ncbi:hypothetical protein ACQB6R_14055 [Propionibacteriaceae bacterium G1746]
MGNEYDQTAVMNPAFQLYDLIEGWEIAPANTRVRDSRIEEGQDYWALLSTVMNLINQVDEYLAEREVITGRVISRISLEHIKSAVMGTQLGLDHAPSSAVRMFSQEDLAWLQGIGASWTRGGFVPVEALGDLRGYVNEIDARLQELELDPALKRYATELCNALGRAITDARVNGGRNVLRLAMELAAVLDTFTDDQKVRSYAKQLRDLWKIYGVPVTIQVMGSSAMLAITAGFSG